MGFAIDIGTGRTFTDGFFTTEREVRHATVPATPHDPILRGAALSDVAEAQ